MYFYIYSFEFLSSIFIFIAALAVFADTADNGIGVCKKVKTGNFSVEKRVGASPLQWGLLVLFFSIIALPWYLIRRSTIVNLAKEQPYKTSFPRGVIILSVLGVILIAVTCGYR